MKEEDESHKFQRLFIRSGKPNVHLHSELYSPPAITDTTMKSTSSTYFPHLDGLRTVSILAVLFFHFNLFNTSGGYVGVDAFFVLSGFLMTRSITHQLDNSTFGFKSFFIRRFWRLYPSMLLTVACTLVSTALLFPTDLASHVAASALASMTSTSNFYFMAKSTYFDASSDQKPLLHTWSLAVEEQFYAIWPLLLFHIVKGKLRVAPWLSTLSVLSFYISIILLKAYTKVAFFMLPGRIFEFGIGGLACYMLDVVPHGFNYELLSALGLASLVQSFRSLDQNTPFPGLNSVIPLTGCLLTIITPNSIINRNLLANAPVRYLGKISYSAYLLHWPLWVFFKRLVKSGAFAATPAAQKIVLRNGGFVLVPITFMLASAQYHLFENPLRRSQYSSPSKRATISAIIAIIATAAGAFFIIATENSNFRKWNKRTDVKVLTNDEYMKELGYGSSVYRDLENKKDPYKLFGRGTLETADALVIGDSHTMMHYRNFFKMAHGANITIITKAVGGCPPTDNATWNAFQGRSISRIRSEAEKRRECTAMAKEIQTMISLKPPRHVVFIAFWAFHIMDYEHWKTKQPAVIESYLKAFRIMVERFQQKGSSIHIVGQVPGPGKDYRPIECFSRPSFFFSKNQCPIATPVMKVHKVANDYLKNMTNNVLQNATFIDQFPYFCDDKDMCVVVKNKELLYRDGPAACHLTPYGAELMKDEILQNLLRKR